MNQAVITTHLSNNLSLPSGGPAGPVSVNSRAAGVRGDAAENRPDCSSDLKVTYAA